MTNAQVFGVMVLTIGGVVLLLAAMHISIDWSVKGRPNWTRRHWWQSEKIRREYERKVADRALQIMMDNPELEYKCEDFPRYKALCGQRCAWSQADAQIRQEQASINAVIRATLGGPK